MNPRERGSDVVPEQSCSEPIGHDAPALNKARETGNPSECIRVGDPNDRSANTKNSLKKKGASVPTLCAYCRGAGMILEGFFGLPQVCPDCKGDGIARP